MDPWWSMWPPACQGEMQQTFPYWPCAAQIIHEQATNVSPQTQKLPPRHQREEYLRHVSTYGGFLIPHGTPKSSILRGFSTMNPPFWGTPIYGTPHMNQKKRDETGIGSIGVMAWGGSDWWRVFAALITGQPRDWDVSRTCSTRVSSQASSSTLKVWSFPVKETTSQQGLRCSMFFCVAWWYPPVNTNMT